jgi:hypothetical protein
MTATRRSTGGGDQGRQGLRRRQGRIQLCAFANKSIDSHRGILRGETCPLPWPATGRLDEMPAAHIDERGDTAPFNIIQPRSLQCETFIREIADREAKS